MAVTPRVPAIERTAPEPFRDEPASALSQPPMRCCAPSHQLPQTPLGHEPSPDQSSARRPPWVKSCPPEFSSIPMECLRLCNILPDTRVRVSSTHGPIDSPKNVNPIELQSNLNVSRPHPRTRSHPVTRLRYRHPSRRIPYKCIHPAARLPKRTDVKSQPLNRLTGETIAANQLLCPQILDVVRQGRVLDPNQPLLLCAGGLCFTGGQSTRLLQPSQDRADPVDPKRFHQEGISGAVGEFPSV